MKTLINKLPLCVEIEGKNYEVNTDFRVWIEIESKIFDQKLSNAEELARILVLAYKELPPDPFLAVKGLLWFYSSGSKPAEGKGVCKPLYSLVQDYDYIVGAFLAEYGIDLTSCDMHWWRFKALLLCLSDGCRFSQIVGYRAADLTAVKDKNQRSFLAKMKRQFKLDDTRSEAEKEAETVAGLEAVF